MTSPINGFRGIQLIIPGLQKRQFQISSEKKLSFSNHTTVIIPLRAMIPQKIDNMLVVGKSIATSHIAAAAYRVHSFEWSSGAAAGNTLAFSLDNAIAPYALVDQLPQIEPQLEALKRRLNQEGNPTAFPDTSIFNENWDNWR